MYLFLLKILIVLKNLINHVIIDVGFYQMGDIMKRFTMRDEEFVCDKCGKLVSRLNYTARDHCPYCLYSKHVDIMPGDRMNTCKGLLKPIGIEKFKDTYKILYKCESCQMEHKNIVAKDDDMNEIIKLSVNYK